MGVFESLGFWYVVFATGLFTAELLIAAGWALVVGLKLIWQRYCIGEGLEHALDQPEAHRPGRRLS